jgi:subtilisin-like proprotein convertase family protein
LALWFGAAINTTSAKSEGKNDLGGGTTFPGTNTGAIPDRGTPGCGPPAGPVRDVSFSVTGISGAPTAVSLNANLTHSWVGDVIATLIAPNGTEHVIFSRTGATTATSCGDSSDLLGVYNFTDTAAGVNWWQAAATAGGADPIPPGNYRTTQAGPQATANNSPATNLSAAFSGVANPNGNWILRLSDVGGGDTGSISAANLTLTGGAAASGPAKNDFDGDGKTDYAIVRNTVALAGGETRVNSDLSVERGSMFKESSIENLGINPGSSRIWYINNSSNNSNTIRAFGTGATGEFFVPEDFDGDGKADIAIWRGAASSGPNGAFFYVLNSSTNTVTQTDFGILGDNPTVVGDYDGDGKADPAVFRCPAFPPGGQCFYYYKGTNNNPAGNITFVPWGNNGPSDVFPNRGDFDGDGKLDFCVQRVNPSQAGQGQFVLRRSSDGGVEYINWNTSSALIVPGDYDGDGKSDFMTVRVISGAVQWALLTRTGAQSYTTFGRTITGFTEFIAQGDYDGDGKTDIAVFRRDNSNADNCFWYVLRSSDGALQTFEYGSTTDTPLSGWDIN